MRPIFGVKTGSVAIAAVVLSLAAETSIAQNANSGTEYCRSVNGRLVCQRITGPGVTGTRSYERWPGGQPALSGSSSDNRYRATGSGWTPQSWGIRNGPYGFAR